MIIHYRYAYVSDFRARKGWAVTLEDSIYVDPGHTEKGIGSRLLGELLKLCRVSPARPWGIVAVISNEVATTSGIKSVKLHTQHGFVHAGIIPFSGTKFGRTFESIFMHKSFPENVTPVSRE